MQQREIFRILDADTDLKVSISTTDGQTDDHIVISSPERDQCIVMSLADFRRMTAAVERQY